MLTPSQPVPVLTLQHQAPGKVATRVSILYVTGKIEARVGIEPRSTALEADTLPTGQGGGGYHEDTHKNTQHSTEIDPIIVHN